MSNHGISRRTLLKAVGVAGATVTFGAGAAKAAPATSRDEFHGMLVYTTRCIGCRTCEVACAASKGLPAPELGPKQVEMVRTTSDRALTVVNRHATKSGYTFLKNQCMHCNQPACASVCLTKALLKTETGQVIWRGNKCMGCRMCMASCPFDVPKFEYSSWNPEIVKCDLCYERTKDGKKPVCVEACPANALTFGTRRELLRIARERIEKNPGSYIDDIYGEHEAGGTGVLYLSRVDFAQLGMSQTVGNEPYPKLSKPFLSAVPLAFTVLPVLMLALNRATRKNDSRDDEEHS
jgi:formate dehydrogenase iron-sulfur subunit